MLLREENIRLKCDSHKAVDLGALIDQLRLRAAQVDAADTADEAWAVLSEYLLLRENVLQAGTEIETAITAIARRFPVLRDHAAAGPSGVAGTSVAIAA